MRRDVISEVLGHLYKVRDWFMEQKQWSFYASSLLIVYEGDTSVSHSNGIDEKSHTSPADVGSRSSDLVDVRMIDFAHAFPIDHHDDNYLFGLLPF